MTWRTLRAIWGLLLLLIIAEPATATPTFVLMIGAGHYNSQTQIPELPGTRNDMRLMSYLFNWKFGIPSANIYVIGMRRNELELNFDPGQQAPANQNAPSIETTRKSIEQGFRWLQGQLDRFGGSGVIYYTGHGGSMIDNERIHRSTQYLIDINGDPIFDFEIHKMLIPMEKHHITLIFDCCHAGGIARGAFPEFADHFGTPKFAVVDPQKLIRAQQAIHTGDKLLDEDFIPAGFPHVLLAACKYREEAQEIPLATNAPDRVSAFTRALFLSLVFAPKTPTYAELRDQTTNLLRHPTRGQTPDLQGGHETDPAIGETRRPLPIAVPIRGNRIPIGQMAGIGPHTIFVGVADASGHRTEKDPYYGVKQVNWFETMLQPGKSAGAASPMVMPITLPSLLNQTPWLVRLAHKKGDDPVDLFPNTHADEVVVISKDKQGNGYDIRVNTAGGQSGLLYHTDTQEQADRRATQLKQWLEQTSAIRSWFNPLHSMGLTLTTNLGPNPDCFVGDTLDIITQASTGGHLLLLGFEQSGSISVLYPNRAEPDLVLQADTPITRSIRAYDPAGETVFVAILTQTPLQLPEQFLNPLSGRDSWSVLPEQRDG